MHISIADLKKTTGVGFGTSGIRALVTDLSDKVVYCYTYAFLKYLENSGLIKDKSVAIAGDLRPSTPHLMTVIAKACQDLGYQVINCGLIPTPAVTFYGVNKQIPSVMVTGSHIPSDRNGVKFSRPDGEVLKPDEASITSMEIDIDESDISTTTLPPVDPQAEQDYINRYLNFFPNNLLENKHIGLYGHSAVGRDIIYSVLTGLGAKVTKIEYSNTFIPIDTEAISLELDQKDTYWDTKYNLDVIVSTDGDSDRPLLADENGNWFKSDIIDILTASYLEVDTVVATLSCSTVLERSKLFKNVKRTKIGSPYVIEAMQNLVKQSHGPVVGYEANGGFLTASSITKNTKTLSPLPSRDALIVLLSVMALARESNLQLSQLDDQLPKRFTSSSRVKNFPTEKSLAIIDKLSTSVDDINQLFSPYNLVVSDINTLDGLRITFTSGDIIHFRPSRNSPEFRDYTEADTPQRAKQLSDIAISIIKSWATA